MRDRRRMIGTALGAFAAGGLAVGLAMGAVGALPASDGGIALGALLVFPIFFKVLFGLFFLAILFRFVGGRRRWAGEGPPWSHAGGDPRSRLNEWHDRAHAEADVDDQNAASEDDSRR